MEHQTEKLRYDIQMIRRNFIIRDTYVYIKSKRP